MCYNNINQETKGIEMEKIKRLETAYQMLNLVEPCLELGTFGAEHFDHAFIKICSAFQVDLLELFEYVSHKDPAMAGCIGKVA